MNDITICETVKAFLAKSLPTLTVGKYNDTGFYGEENFIIHLKNVTNPETRYALSPKMSPALAQIVYGTALDAYPELLAEYRKWERDNEAFRKTCADHRNASGAAKRANLSDQNWFKVMSDYFQEKGVNLTFQPFGKNNLWPTITFTGHEWSDRAKAFQNFRKLCLLEKDESIRITVRRYFQADRCTVGERVLGKNGFWHYSMTYSLDTVGVELIEKFLAKNDVRYTLSVVKDRYQRTRPIQKLVVDTANCL